MKGRECRIVTGAYREGWDRIWGQRVRLGLTWPVCDLLAYIYSEASQSSCAHCLDDMAHDMCGNTECPAKQ